MDEAPAGMKQSGEWGLKALLWATALPLCREVGSRVALVEELDVV